MKTRQSASGLMKALCAKTYSILSHGEGGAANCDQRNSTTDGPARQAATIRRIGTAPAGLMKRERQKDGGKNMRTGDFFAPIFLPLVLLRAKAGVGRGMIGRGIIVPKPSSY